VEEQSAPLRGKFPKEVLDGFAEELRAMASTHPVMSTCCPARSLSSRARRAATSVRCAATPVQCAARRSNATVVRVGPC
jgi:hypothetical protein